MEEFEVVQYSEEFYPAGFRKIFALMLVVGVTVLPTVFTWVGNPPLQSESAGMQAGDFGRNMGRLSGRQTRGPGVFASIGAFISRSLIVLTTTLGLMLYYPRRGFKRYSLVCGPLIALLVPAAMGQYLQGRSGVFRAEILIVTLISMVPGVGLYVYLTWRKAKRLGMMW